MVKWSLTVALLALCAVGHAREPATVVRTTTLMALFPAEEAQALAATLDPDKPLHYRVRIPQNSSSSGVLVFVQPIDSGELPETWTAELDRRNLIWVAAEDFGNEHPRAQRVLAALAGLKLIETTEDINLQRAYVGGMSGGGRIASQIITRFPRHFSGALYIVGADFWTQAEVPLQPRIAANRYVFVTGSRDFNHRDMRRVFKKYQAAGVHQILLMDLPGFGHEYPNAEQLGQAIDFLDAR
jgi:predicted esterase